MDIIRTSSADSDFKTLCAELDAELNGRYGKAQSQYDQYNIIEENNTVLVGYHDGCAVACGCMKPVDDKTIEIKRMFVRHDYRRKGISTDILSSLEKWATELGYSQSVLETGKGQPEAINLYIKQGYSEIDRYGQYINLENSICMKKEICTS